MRKDNKIRKMHKKSIIFSVITGVASIICIGLVVAFIFTCFTGYVFSDLYTNNENDSEKITDMITEHVKLSQSRINSYGEGISDYISSGYSGNEIDYEGISQVFKAVSSGNGYVNFGLKIYNNASNMGTLSKPVEETNFYSKAVEGVYGTSYEILEGNVYLTYTFPVLYNNTEVGVLYATERGNLADIYYDYIDDAPEAASTGVRVCYLLSQDNQVIAYSGNGSNTFKYKTDEKQQVDTGISKTINNGGFEMYIESANSKFGIVGDKIDGKTFRSWFTDYMPTYVNEDSIDNNIELSNIWYKYEINLDLDNNTKLYTWIQAKTYIEYDTVIKLFYAAFICIIVLFIPFLLLLVSTISKIRSNRKMAGLLYVDTVTGYGNWFYFEESGEKILRKRRNRDVKFAMVSFEVNKYRIMLDYYGDNFEEKILGAISFRLKKWMGKNEVYARYAESQYALLISYENEEELVLRVKRILDDVSEYIVNKKINFKAGIYLIEDKTMSISSINLIAMGAKDSKEEVIETKVIMYSSKIREQQRKERMIEETMEKALEHKEFKVYLQPKYSPDKKELLGAEALVRWINDENIIISPGEFIGIFEKNGFITKLDDYMIDAVAKLQAQWKENNKKFVPISVNVSRIHFQDKNLADHIKEIVDKYDVDHKYIEIELTESAFFDDKDVLLNTIQKLHEYGFVVSMDDFGSGYSSLNSLKNLPLDVIKLDGEFFNESEDKERGETVVKNTIVLAKNLNMKIVAEGIETKEQVDFLGQQGCDLIQGFYFAKPMPVEEFDKFL